MRLEEKIQIEKPTVDDAEILKTLWLNLAREMFEIERHIVPSVENADVWTSYLLHNVEAGRDEALIARRNKEPVGFVHWAYPTSDRYRTSTRFAVIHDLYVKPAYRRMGIGTKLMEEAVKRIRQKGIEDVRLSVLSENVEAVRFYKKLGFKVYRYEMSARADAEST